MPSLFFIVPGDLEGRTGGYAYDRRILAGLTALGWAITTCELDGSFPHPTSGALDQAARVLADIPDSTTVMIDGLALGAMPDQAVREANRLRIIALVHHPLAAETGLDPADAAALEESERRALAAARLVIVTSEPTARALERYHVTPSRIVVIEPGTDRGAISHGAAGEAVNLLCVATLIPRKGHDVLLRALAKIRDLPWQLTCVGSLDRSPGTTTRLRALIQSERLEGRVSLAGEHDDLEIAVEYARADVFVLPTLFEGHGMAVAEALAHGLPVVSTDTGAIGEMVGDSAGILVPAGDVDALARALRSMISDPVERARYAEGARLVRNRLPTWLDASRQFAAALARVAPGFSSEWLALREQADTRARSERLTQLVADRLPKGRRPTALDLGAGTGANARYLSERLPDTEWLLVDRDEALLAIVAQRRPAFPTCSADLSTLADQGGAEWFRNRDLVTASALLDLVSEQWLRAIAVRCLESRACVLFALTYDGRIDFTPPDPEDDAIRRLVNAHQKTDKGFGPALGPDAAEAAAVHFAAAGYHVERESSDWVLMNEDAELQRQLIEGWAEAAIAMAPERSAAIAGWAERRSSYVKERRSRLVVGHQDVVGWLVVSGS